MPPEDPGPLNPSDGKELFFLSLSHDLMVAEVRASADTFEVGQVTELFEFIPGTRFRSYAPAPDGKRFLLVVAGERPAPAPLTLVVNWTSELADR